MIFEYWWESGGVGEWGGDGSVGRSGGRRAGSVGSINGAVGAVGVGCTVAWVARMHGNPLVSGVSATKSRLRRALKALPRAGQRPAEAILSVSAVGVTVTGGVK